MSDVPLYHCLGCGGRYKFVYMAVILGDKGMCIDCNRGFEEEPDTLEMHEDIVMKGEPCVCSCHFDPETLNTGVKVVSYEEFSSTEPEEVWCCNCWEDNAS